MVRKTVKKRKLNEKPMPRKYKRKNVEHASKNAQSSQANSSTISDLNFTLPEGNHLDSFDIFRSNEEQVLRAKNLLKKNVHASFNRDSSIDNDDDFDECLQMTDPLSTSSVILIQDKENTINIDQTDSFGDQSMHFRQSQHSTLSIEEDENLPEVSPFKVVPKYKSAINQFSQQNAVPTSTPQKPSSVLPGPNQYFRNLETDLIVDKVHSKSSTDNTNGVSHDMIVPQTSNVAARRRRPLTKNVQTRSAVHEQNRKTTKSNGIDQGNTVAGADQIEIDDSQDEHLESNRISTRSRKTAEHENNCVHKALKNGYFSSTESDEAENEQLSVNVDVHDSPIQLGSSSTATTSNPSADKLTKDATTTADDTLCLSHEHNETNEVHGESQSIQAIKGHEIQQSSCSNDTSNDKSSHMNKNDSSNRLCKNQQIDNISISSDSFNLTPIPSKGVPTATASISNENRLTKPKTKVGFNTSCLVHEKSTNSENTSHENAKIQMKGGKWRRTIVEIRKNKSSQLPRLTLQSESDRNSQQSIRRKSIFIKDIPCHNRLTTQVRGRSQIVTVLDDSETSVHQTNSPSKSFSTELRVSKPRSNILQTIRDSFDLDESEESVVSHHSSSNNQLSIFHKSLLNDESAVNEIERSTSNLHIEYGHDELKAQLLKRCGQTNVLAFNETYSARLLRKCKKIGEGVFGEVFLNDSTVLKIIPIEGDIEINGATQKRFDEILQEVIISQELSALRLNRQNFTTGFVEVLNVRLVEGSYPAHLLKLWDEYDSRKESENERPDVFDANQLYIVFELMNGGCDLEAHVFKNANQSYSVFKQVAISLAVAELQFQFEHRDLHWGNVLVAPTTETTITFYLNGKSIEVPTHGIKATIIDYTLSRIVYKNCCLFQDLAADPELFEAMGDYQYDIYRLMRDKTENCWAVFKPYTNVLWLHYIIDKITSTDGVKYTAKKGVKHRQIINEMLELRDNLLKYQNAIEYAKIL